MCFVVWIVWRTVKKNKKNKNGNVVAATVPGRRNRLLGRLDHLGRLAVVKVPFLNRRWRGWRNLDGPDTTDVRGIPPTYEKATGAADSTTQQQMAGPAQPTNGLTLVTHFATNFTAHQAGPSFSSVSASQFGTVSPSDESGTLRSRMPDAFFNQSELARQPSQAYDPARRLVNRTSELSSLSSGFGDGDIIVPLAPPPVQASLRQSNNFVGRFSWMSRGDGSGDAPTPTSTASGGTGTSTSTGNRDTVYTEASEDSPPRFRTVNSWVYQQTGRVQRAEQRSPQAEEIPPVPDLSMMADDGEVPRRPDTIPANSGKS